MGLLAGVAGGLAFVHDAVGKLAPLGPSGGAAVRVAVDEEGRSLLLEKGREVNGARRLADSALEAGHGYDHFWYSPL